MLPLLSCLQTLKFPRNSLFLCPLLLLPTFWTLPSTLSIQASIMKIPQTGQLKQWEFYVLTLLETVSPGSRCQKVWFLLRPLSLACIWHASCCFFTQSFLCAGIPGVSPCIKISYSCENISQIRLESTAMASFYHGYHFKAVSQSAITFWGTGVGGGRNRILDMNVSTVRPIRWDVDHKYPGHSQD